MKAVVFDFDGTLTYKRTNLWKQIWKQLGYDISPNSYYVSLINSFKEKEITHKEWCNLTLKAFQEKGFNKQLLDRLINKISLLNGVEDLIKSLYKKGVELHIVSGNIIYAIKKVLGENIKYFAGIKANEFVFDEQGNIINIVGTRHDFEGKADYINELCLAKGCSPKEICFVGNGGNDEFVYKSGCKTICVNPDDTKFEDREIWHKVIYTNEMLDILNEILD